MTKTGFGHDNIMGHRVISGLVSASVSGRPGNMPISRLRGTRRLGTKYESDFSKALKAKFPRSILSGQWFYFVDTNGTGYCQTDVLLKRPDECIIFECKLTDTEKGRSQLSRLYFPVVAQCFKLPVRGVVVTRHLTRETVLKNVTDLLEEAIQCPRDIIPTLHWRERTPL